MTAPAEGAEPRILFVLYTNPMGYPPIMRAARLLRQRGARVRMLGTSGLASDALGRDGSDPLDLRLVSRRGTGIVQKARFAWFTLWALVHLQRWRPRWVYASDPLTSPIALVAKRLGFRVAYHEHDTPPGEAGAGRPGVMGRIRRATLRAADLVVVPNEERAAVVRDAGGRNVVTVWNCPSLAEVGPTAGRRGTSGLRLIYQGSVVPARLPFAVIEALARAAGQPTLSVIGYETEGALGYLAALRARAESLGIGAQLSLLGPLPHDETLRRSSEAHIGLALFPVRSEDLNERTMVGASNKVFEYLARGVALLVSDMPEWRAAFGTTGMAFVCDPEDPQSIADALDRASADMDAVLAMGERGRAQILAAWNYETCFAPVAARLLEAS